MEESTVIAIDLAKTKFEIAVSDEPGRVNRHRRLDRSELLVFFAQGPRRHRRHGGLRVGPPRGSSARTPWTQGRAPAPAPRPTLRHPKQDGPRRCQGILEAYRNADIHPVPVKTIPQHVLGPIHRFRSGWIAARTAQVNTLRGLLRELGLFIPEGIEKVLPQVRLLIADPDSGIPDPLRATVAAACDEIQSLGEQIDQAEKQLEALAVQTPVVARLRSIPGIGLMTATALVAFIGDIVRFPSGREFASYLGLTPREYSSGPRQRLGRISKRGDSYLRMLLVHGARSVLCHAKKAKSHDALRTWALKLQSRTRHNKAAVALANKLARIAWAVWKNGREHQSMPVAA